MNKRNYSVNEAEKQELVRISQSVRKEIICAMSKAGIFQRKRKLTSYTLLFEALYRYLVDGLSFYQLAGYIDCRYHVKLSVTAWKKQLYKAIPILREIVEEYMAKHAMSACKARERQNTYALDATAFSIEGHNGTCVRVHAQVSVKDGLCRYDKITDEHRAESVKNFPIEQGALYLADRAYAKAQQIAWILEHHTRSRVFLCRSTSWLYKNPSCTKRLEVDTLLDRDLFSRICYIQHHEEGLSGAHRGKATARRSANSGSKKVRKKACKNQTTLQKRTLLHANWVFLMTTLRHIPSTKLFEIYRQRWQIEIYFKHAKTLLVSTERDAAPGDTLCS